MADAASSDRPRLTQALARAMVASARSRALYPSEHPAVGAARDRLEAAAANAGRHGALALGVTPDALIIDDEPPMTQGPAAEAAALLHARDILRLVLAPAIEPPAIQEFVELLAADPVSLRERGGPAAVWAATGLAGIAITQVDYQKVLEDREVAHPARRDDLWQAIVRSVLERKKVLDETVQRRLLEIAGDADAIGELAEEVMAPHCTPDGSPLLTTQAAAVVAAYNHLHNIVAVLAPERRDEMFRNLASATARLDPRVVMQMLHGTEAAAGPGGASAAGSAADEGGTVVRGIAATFDDVKVAQLLATTLALEGHASARLASVFETIAPDEERRRRVLRLTRTLLHETDFGRRNGFESLWQSMEELLMTYNERPFVSARYQAGLDQAGERAAHMAAADLPLELGAWLETLGQDSVRRLSVMLLIDLLNLETDPARAPSLAIDLAALAEDMLMAGDYEAAADIAQAMAARAADRAAVTREACRVGLDELGRAAALREALGALDEMESDGYLHVHRFCRAVGPPAVESLRELAAYEDGRAPRARARACEMIVAMGAPAVSRVTPLVAHAAWHVQRNACEILEAIAAPEAVPLLQPLLRSRDSRVLRAAIKALSNIDDPSAARAVHTALRVTTGQARQAVVSALAAERDPRVVPVLGHILAESDPLGADHIVVLDTLTALGSLGPLVTDAAVGTVAELMRRRRWFARKKARALAAGAAHTLRQVGTPAAHAALVDASETGDRLLRKIVGAAS